MRKILLTLTLLSIGNATAQTATTPAPQPATADTFLDQYGYTWEQAAGGYYGAQKAGMNAAIATKTANLGEAPVIIATSLIKTGETSGIFDCVTYENMGGANGSLSLRITETTKFVKQDLASKGLFEILAKNDKGSKVIGMSVICAVKNLGMVMDTKSEVVQIPANSKVKLKTLAMDVYATLKMEGLDVTPEISFSK
ncbi:hypothetical protein Dcar01_02397 [Deinococcus carri]|uniref:Lipid/polyisoprenoid-binding YceI-like domain-containing protein n=1 Tax=Deinococcus carri TaxID=1211323 RepID=A0ABP9WC62_9DEIO